LQVINCRLQQWKKSVNSWVGEATEGAGGTPLEINCWSRSCVILTSMTWSCEVRVLTTLMRRVLLDKFPM